MKEQRGQIQKPSYDVCVKALDLLDKLDASTLSADEELDLKIVRLMLEEMKFDFMIKDVQAIVELYRGGFISKADLKGFMQRRPELAGTTLGQVLLSMEED
jgi:hypothetical protein